MSRRAIIAAILSLLSSFSHAEGPIQSDSLQTYQRIDLSYVFGGQIYNNNLIYNPGVSFQTAYGIRVNESVCFGLGTGIMALTDERFAPIFFETTGYRKNKANSPFIRMQIGYSFAWYAGPMEAEGYRFRGGIYLDAGMGRKIQINSKYSVSFHWSYRHQFAHMEYEVFGGERYTEPMNFDMFVISLGLIRL